jgi:hypothetical protein
VEGAFTAADDAMLDELWAVLHGMAILYLDRSAAFDLKRAQHCVFYSVDRHSRSPHPEISSVDRSRAAGQDGSAATG